MKLKFSLSCTLIIIIAILLSSCGGVGILDYKNAKNYSVGNAEFTQKIENIEISWINGSVTVESTDSDTLTVSEQTSRETSPKETVHWWLDGTTLHIKYAESGIRVIKRLSKDLTVRVPAGILDGLTIDNVSSEITVTDISSSDLDINNVSGAINITGAVTNDISIDNVSGGIDIVLDKEIEDIEIDSVSGKIDAECPGAKSFDITSVSGSITLSFAKAPKTGKIDVVSGKTTLYIPSGADCTIKLDTVSGDMSSSIPFTVSGKKYISGTGENYYNIETVSGNVRVEEIE